MKKKSIKNQIKQEVMDIVSEQIDKANQKKLHVFNSKLNYKVDNSESINHSEENSASMILLLNEIRSFSAKILSVLIVVTFILIGLLFLVLEKIGLKKANSKVDN